MKFTEQTLEQAVIELFKEVEIPHYSGESIHKEINDVLLRDDLIKFLSNRYSNNDITGNEIESFIRRLELYPSSNLYESNKAIMKLVADGFLLNREDRSKKDIFIEVIDYKTGKPPKNDKLTSELKEQLMIYGAALKDVFNLEPITLSYYFLENNRKISFSPEEKDFEKLKSELKKRIENIY